MECVCPETSKGHLKTCPCRGQKRVCPHCNREGHWPVGLVNAEGRCAKCKLGLADDAAKARFYRLPRSERFLPR